MRKYIAPSIQIIVINSTDIIATSIPVGGSGPSKSPFYLDDEEDYDF